MSDEFQDRYYPTICLRRAEMKAMEMMPLSEKMRMLPVVLLAPWLNSKEFENSIKIVSKSLENIPIIVDLDRYFISTSPLPSREFFRKILNGEKEFELWKTLISENSNYIPCVQIFDVQTDDIISQIDFFSDLGRGFCFRFELERYYDFDLIFDIIRSCEIDNFLCIFDCGYGNDIISKEAIASPLIERLTNISQDARFVISSSNFPNEFSDFDNFNTKQMIGARLLFNNLKGKFGNYRMFYGDWASTKPRRYDGGGSAPIPRIDFPTKLDWIIARSKEDEWDFHDAALRITRLQEWADRPPVWGSGMIEKTALGLPNAIDTGPKAIAARINIHLYEQANYSLVEPKPVPTAKWSDPI